MKVKRVCHLIRGHMFGVVIGDIESRDCIICTDMGEIFLKENHGWILTGTEVEITEEAIACIRSILDEQSEIEARKEKLIAMHDNLARMRGFNSRGAMTASTELNIEMAI